MLGLDAFQGLLDREFSGHYRVRQSSRPGVILIEQKIGRAAEFFATEDDDSATRVRDGYKLVANVAPSGRFPCIRCEAVVYVPTPSVYHRLACRECGAAQAAGQWDLGEPLLTYLTYWSPFKKHADGATQKADEHNLASERAMYRQMEVEGEAALKDRFNRIVNIQQVGYTGKEKAWDRSLGKV